MKNSFSPLQPWVFRGQMFFFLMLSAVLMFQYEVIMMERGISLSTALRVFGVSQIVSMASVYVWGRAVRKARQVNRLIQGALIFRILILLLMYVVGSDRLFIALFLLYCTIWGSVNTVFEGRLTQWVFNHRLSFGKFRLWGSIGFAVSGFIVSGLYLFITQSASILLFMMGVNFLILIGSLKYPIKVEMAEKQKRPQKLEIRYLLLLVMIATVVILPDTFSVVLNNHYREAFGLTIEGAVFYTGIALMLGAFVSEVPAFLMIDRLIGRFGYKKMLMTGLFLSIARWVLSLVATSHPLLFTFTYLFHGVVFAFLYVGCLNFIQDKGGNEATGAFIINFTLITGIIGFIKTQLFSVILEFYTTYAVLGIFTAISIAACLLYWRFYYLPESRG